MKGRSKSHVLASLLRATSVEAVMNSLNSIHLRWFKFQPVSTVTNSRLGNGVLWVTVFCHCLLYLHHLLTFSTGCRLENEADECVMF